MNAFTPGDQVSDGRCTGTVVAHEHLASWCRPQATGLVSGWVLALARKVRPRPVPPPLVVDGRVYDGLVPVAWDDGSVSVTRAYLLRPARRSTRVGVVAGA